MGYCNDFDKEHWEGKSQEEKYRIDRAMLKVLQKREMTRERTIYLAKTGFGNAIYIPENKIKFICPQESEKESDFCGASIDFSFFINKSYKKDELENAFKHRINNPKDNTINVRGEGMWFYYKAMPLPIKQKELLSEEKKKLDNLIYDMLGVNNHSISTYPIQKMLVKRDYPPVIEMLQKTEKAINCLKDYNLFFENIYQKAKWFGDSEEAYKWNHNPENNE